MSDQFIPYWEHVKGQTFCIVTDYCRIPVYVLEGNRAIMMDSGYAISEGDIMRLLEEKNLTVAAILTSHAHPDHTGCHVALRNKYGCKIYMTPFAAATCSDPLTMYSNYGGRAGYRPLSQQSHRFFPVDEIIPWEDCEITVEGAVFQVIKTSGHCVEHVSFINPDHVAYLGDALQSADIMRYRRLTYSTGLEADLEARHKIATLRCDKYILAHNGVIEDVAEEVRIADEETERRLAAFVAQADNPVTMDELIRRFLVQSGADLSNRRSVEGVYFNAVAFIGYLVDAKRLNIIIEDGYLKYVRPQ